VGYEEGQAEVEKIAREIYTSLTGNLITLDSLLEKQHERRMFHKKAG
jgi:hypothetical protein